MKILIVVHNSYTEASYKKFLSIIEDMGYDFIGFISIYEKEICNLRLGNNQYIMYPIDYLQQLEYDKILIASNIQYITDAVITSLLQLEVPQKNLQKFFG